MCKIGYTQVRVIFKNDLHEKTLPLNGIVMPIIFNVFCANGL
jgi:hypothetical protein